MERPRFGRINRDLLVYKAFYFFFLSGFGSLFPYLTVYFRQIGLPASQVGLLIGFRPIVQFASAPFWAITADRYRKRKAILVMSVLAWIIMTLALAFVEPTDEICEVRLQNGNLSHFVNYTKVKTGFFRRSVLSLRTSYSIVGDEIEASPDLVVVPFHRMGIKVGGTSSAKSKIVQAKAVLKKSVSYVKNVRASKTQQLEHFGRVARKLSSMSKTLSGGLTLSLNNKQKNSLSIKNKTYTRLSETNTTLVDNGTSISKIHSITKEENGEQVVQDTISKIQNTLVGKTNASDLNNSLKSNHPSSPPGSSSDSKHNVKPKGRHLPRRIIILNEKISNNKRRVEINKALDSASGMNSGQDVREPEDSTGVHIAGDGSKHVLSEKYGKMKKVTAKNEDDASHNKALSKPRHKPRSQPAVIEFSRVELPDIRKENSKFDDVQTLTSEDGESSGNHQKVLWKTNDFSFASNITEAAKRLKVQVENHISKAIQSSLNVSFNISKSNEELLHRTLSIVSKTRDGSIPSKKEKERNMSHLSQMLTSIMKTNDIAEFSGQESSTEASALPFSTVNKDFSHKLASILVSHKGSLKTLDSLHQDSMADSNAKVIHHNVLSDVTALGSSSYAVSAVDLKEHASLNIQESKSDLTSDSSGSGSVVVPLENLLEHRGEKKSFLENAISEDDRNTLGLSTDVDFEKKKKTWSHLRIEQVVETTTKYEFSGEGIDVESHSPIKSVHLQLDSVSSQENKGAESQFKVTMKNLLKSNTLELKRIFTILLIIIVVGEFLESPCFTLADASLLEMLGEERRNYGKQRLWGSLGFGSFSFIVGILLERSRHVICGEQYTDYMICFCFFAILMLMTLFVSTAFDFKYSDIKPTGARVFSALCNIHYGSCLFAACIMGVDFGMCHNFLNWFLEDLGASKTLMGIAIISRCFADTLTFYFAGSIIKAVGQIRIMVVVLISYSVIFSSYTMLQNPWWVIPIEVLNGITYAMAWSACTSYLAGATSPESVTTIQGILQGVYWGLGTGSGAIAGGYLIHHVGAVATFRLTAGCSLLVCIIFCFVQWKWTNDTPTDFPQTKYTYLPTVETKDTEALLSGYDTYTPRTKKNYGRTRRDNTRDY